MLLLSLELDELLSSDEPLSELSEEVPEEPLLVCEDILLEVVEVEEE